MRVLTPVLLLCAACQPAQFPPAPPWVMAMAVPVDDLQVRVAAPEGFSLRLVRGEGVGKHIKVPGDHGVWTLRETQLAPLAHGMTTLAPKPVQVESAFGKYEARLVQKAALVVYTRRLNLTARVVPHDQRAQLASFAAQIRAAEGVPMLLRSEE